MPRPSNTEQRQMEIVEGLMRQMAIHGYDQSSIGAIAEAAGLSQGVVHYHFKNKQQILLRLVELLAEIIRGRYEKRVTAESTPIEQLSAYIDAHVALGDDAEPAAVACWVYIGAEAIRQPEVAEVYGREIKNDLELLQGIVRDILSAKKRSHRSAARIASAIFAAIQGSFQLAAAAPESIPPGTAASSIKAMARGLLETEGSAQ